MNKTIIAVTLSAGSLFAQEKAPEPANLFHGTVALAPATTQFISAMNVGPVIMGAPYSAEAVNESIQTLYDGNRIVEKSTTKVYRDSEGRERREEGSPMNVVFITDPVSKTNYTLHPDTMTAEKAVNGRQMFFFQSFDDLRTRTGAAATIIGSGGGRGGPVNILTTRSGAVTAGVAAIPATAPLTLTVGPEPGSAKVEDLGTKMIEGVQAKGTRATTVIPSGQIGNDRDIEVVDERWYSPELQLTIMTTHTDPRTGQTNYKLTNIQRIEQVRSLFEMPSNYTLVNESVRGPEFRFAQPVPAPAKKEE